MEEFIITSILLLMNEPADIPTSETIRCRSWTDLTICNIVPTQNTRRWPCGEAGSSSDRKLILFGVEGGTGESNAFNHQGKRYQMKAEDWGQFWNKRNEQVIKFQLCE
jgi:hypothetical protein